MIRYTRALAVLAAAVLGAAAVADEPPVGVAGSAAKFPPTAEVAVNGKPVRLVLTGTGMRRKLVKVYAVASYVQDGTPVRTADQLIAADAVKLLHIVLERHLEGPRMADGIREGISLNHADAAFAAELDTIEGALKDQEMEKGEDVFLTSLPGVGLRCQVKGKADVTVHNPAFARAVWQIYLGPKNIGEACKAGLLSRLGRPRGTP
jgi:Chalcone isomerase-like